MINESDQPQLEAEPSTSPVTNPTHTRSPIPMREILTILLLLLILLLAGYFRFVGLDWDANHHLHPDERFLTIVSTNIQSTDPFTYLKTSESSLNPYNKGEGFYVYGNFPMTVTRLVAEWLANICSNSSQPEPTSSCERNPIGYDGIHLVGRALSGLLDLCSVFFVFLIGRRLYSWQAGLLGALLLAVAVMPIQQAHFYTMDNWAAGLTSFSLYMAVRASENGRQMGWWALFGLGLGLAVASRINMAPLAVMAGVAAIVWLVRSGQLSEKSWGGYLGSTAGSKDVQWAVLGVMVAAMVSAITFRLAQPYAFMDAALVRQTAVQETGVEPSALEVMVKSVVGLNPQWLKNMAEIQSLQSPEASFPPALQWTDRAAILFPLNNMVLYGMGVSAGIVACFAFLWALWRILRAHPDWAVQALPVAWVGLYFLFMGTRWVKSVRYFLPVYPFLLMLAGWALVELYRKASRQSQQGRNIYRDTVLVFALLTIIPSLLWANSFVQIYRQPVTRVAASEWMYEHIRSGATLLYEVNGQPQELQLPLKGYDLSETAFPLNLAFTMPAEGTVTAIRFNYFSDPDGGEDSESLALRLVHARHNDQPLAEATAEFNLDNQRRAYLVEVQPVILVAGEPYMVVVEGTSANVIRAGTSVIANEHWDDALPVRLEGRDAYSQYFTGVTGGQVPITHQDNSEKLTQMLSWLEESDVIVLSSQRAIWNTARLPLMFPLTMQYYESLFNGELGFDLAVQFHADLRIGNLYISDTTGQIQWGSQPYAGWPPPNEFAAEEAFSVYDHPPVWIFVKTDRYNRQEVGKLLGATDLSQQMFMTPGQATQAPNGLQLTEQEFAVQRANGTFEEIFPSQSPLNRYPTLAAIVWWLAVIGLGWLTFPICYLVFSGLSDRGYGLSRILSLLLVSYFGWILASVNIAPNTRGTLWVGVGLLAVVSGAILMRERAGILPFIRQHLRHFLFVELLGIGLYLLFIGIRLGNPDVWDIIWGGEKPMDLSYFTAVLKSTIFPPYDPWFAGGYINYYYYGFVYVGSLTKLLGVVPTTAYNLILPMLFSFVGVGAFSGAYNLVAKLQPPTINRQYLQSAAARAGIAGMALCVLLGNLAQLGVLLDAWYRTSDSTTTTNIPLIDRAIRVLDGGYDILIAGKEPAIYPGDWFWTASRAINANPGEAGPITEFPFFTFLYGDLHAHMISMPLMLLALGWAIALALQSYESPPRWEQTVLQWLIGGLAIGVLQATNTWDLPTYLVIGCLAILFATYRQFGGLHLRVIGTSTIRMVVLVAIAITAFLPYSQHYGSGYTSAILWEGSRTYLGNYLAVYGLFLFLILTYVAQQFRNWTTSWTTTGLAKLEPISRILLVAMGAYLVLMVGLVWRGYWVAPIVLTIVVITGLLGLRGNVPASHRILLILTSSAFALTLIVEIVTLQGDIGRMNTVFKFYMQVWLILSVIGGAAYGLVAARRGRIWHTFLTVLICMAALYPFIATGAKWKIRMSKEAPYTLDGMVFMQTTEYGDTSFDGSGQIIPLNYEYDALRWVQANIPGSPVIVEGHSHAHAGFSPYRSITNRVAMYTGLPAVVGWDWHQRQQRAVLPGNLVSNRINEVNQFYNTTDIEEAVRFLEKYQVEYIYAGRLEWTYYYPEGMHKFEEMAGMGLLEQVYQANGVSIYRVKN